MNAGLGVRIALHADSLARTFACAGIRLGALATDGQSAEMADAAVALDALETLQVHTDFAAEIAFDHVFAVLDGMNDLRKLGFGEVASADGTFDPGFLEDQLCVHRADAINVAKGNIDPLLAGNINT